jgi:hypothetical protein
MQDLYPGDLLPTQVGVSLGMHFKRCMYKLQTQNERRRLLKELLRGEPETEEGEEGERSLRRRVRMKREKMKIMLKERTVGMKVGMKVEKNLISSQILLSQMRRMNLKMKRTPLTRRWRR